jgi:Ca-activated chloride channel family protein
MHSIKRLTSQKRHARIPSSLLVATTCALLLVAAPPAPQRAQQQSQDDDVISVNTDLVVLNVTATDAKGEYVHGLKRADFKVFEDGHEQQLTNFGVEETPFAAALLLDVSGSMEGRISLARSAAIRFLDGLREDDVAAVYTFHSKVEQVQDFSQERDLTPRTFGINATGMTVLNDAVVRAANDLARRPEKRRTIIVLSDGADTLSSASFDKALSTALAANATIYTVDMADRDAPSLSTAASSGALKNFATKSGGRYVATPGGRELRAAFAEIVEELGNQYTLGYRPANDKRDGKWRTVDVKIARPDVKARTRRGYRLSKP